MEDPEEPEGADAADSDAAEEEKAEEDSDEPEKPEEDSGDVDYAVVGGPGRQRPEISPAREPEREPARPGSDMQPIDASDRGLVIRTSRLSYLWTYALAGLVLLFFLLAVPSFGMAFYLHPETFIQTMTDIMMVVFVFAAASFAAEADIERAIRQYIVTNSEVVKLEGVLRKVRVIIPYQSVSNVVVDKGVLGRLLGFGDVNVIGFDAEIRMKGVRDPDTLYRIIENKIARMRAGRFVAAQPLQQADEERALAGMDWPKLQQPLGAAGANPGRKAGRRRRKQFK